MVLSNDELRDAFLPLTRIEFPIMATLREEIIRRTSRSVMRLLEADPLGETLVAGEQNEIARYNGGYYLYRDGVWSSVSRQPLLTHVFDGVQAPALFGRNDGGYLHSYKREPSLARSSSGRIHMVTINLPSALVDDQTVGFSHSYSDDRAQTWSPVTFPVSSLPGGERTSGAQIVASGTHLTVLFQTLDLDPKENPRLWACESDDDGETWGSPYEIENCIDPSWVLVYSGANAIVIQGGPHAGREIFPLYYRYVDGGTAYPYIVYRDGPGGTWTMSGLTAEGTFDGSCGESAVVELGDENGNPSGILLVNSRTITTSQPRTQHIVTDGGTTWGAGARANDLPLVESECCLARIPGTQTLLLAGPLGTYTSNNYRYDQRIFISYDNGATWPDSRVIYPGPGAYAALLYIGQGEFLVVYECGDVGSGGNASTWAAWMRAAIFNIPFVTQPQVLEFRHCFNELPAGHIVPLESRMILDHGNTGYGIELDDLGTLPSYAESNGKRCLRLNGTNQYLRLSDADHRPYKPLVGQSFGWQLEFATTRTADQRLLNTGDSGSGIRVTVGETSVTAVVVGSSTTATLTASATLGDGARHTISLERDLVANEIRLWIDGDLADAETSTVPTGAVGGDTHTTIGRTNAGTMYFEGDIYDHQWVVGRALSPSEIWDPATSEQLLSLGPAGYDLTPLPVAARTPALYLPPPSDEVFANAYAVRNLGAKAPGAYQEGRGLPSIYMAGDKLGVPDSESRGMVCRTVDGLRCYELLVASNANVGTGPVIQQSVASDLAEIHRTGKGTIAVAFRLAILPPAGGMYVLDSANATSANSGLTLLLASSVPGEARLSVSKGESPSRFTRAAGSAAIDTWYLAHWRFNGLGAAVFAGLTPFANSTITESSSGTVDGSAVSTNMSANLKIGERVGVNAPGFRGWLRAVYISTEFLSNSDVQALFDLWKAGP